MATVRIRTAGLVVQGPSPAAVARVQRRLKSGARPVTPVVRSFVDALARSVDIDFQVGGRPPFVWAPNRPNTVAAKGTGRVLIGGTGAKGKMQRGIRYVVSGDWRSIDINVSAPFPGMLHQRGVPHRWAIQPVRARVLSFLVANAGIARRRGARHAGERAFARRVVHPGLPARKFIVVRDGLLREAWRAPLRAFLFEGRNPPAVPHHPQVVFQVAGRAT